MDNSRFIEAIRTYEKKIEELRAELANTSNDSYRKSLRDQILELESAIRSCRDCMY